jgi:hypothetical protein
MTQEEEDLKRATFKRKMQTFIKDIRFKELGIYDILFTYTETNGIYHFLINDKTIKDKLSDELYNEIRELWNNS